MKCKNQYGWQEVLTCKQRWMTGSSISRNPRWLNFLWSYFRQVELSAKFKVKCLTNVESIKSYTFATYCWKSQSFFKLMSNLNVPTWHSELSWLAMWLDHVTGPCASKDWWVECPRCPLDHVLSALGWTWSFTPWHWRNTLSHTLCLFFLDSAVFIVFV